MLVPAVKINNSLRNLFEHYLNHLSQTPKEKDHGGWTQLDLQVSTVDTLETIAQVGVGGIVEFHPG